MIRCLQPECNDQQTANSQEGRFLAAYDEFADMICV
jgi:hypothetical protein